MDQANGNIMSFSLHEFAHLHIPLEDISSATNNFANENIIVHGGTGKLYKGQLKQHGQLLDIVARRLEGIYGQGKIELWTEISMLSSLKHKNLASILGFCDENGEKIIIYEHAVHGCLDQHLRDQNFTWSQRLKICLGVARALNYIHYDVVHCGICSSKVLIDKDFEAKLFGFELSTKYPGNWGHRLLISHYLDTSAYKDPMYRNTLSMTPKYDVYSFGVLLFDVLSGGKPIIRDYAITEKLDAIIYPNLREQMDTQSLTIFSKTAYNCLSQHSVQRPSMDQIVKELENALELQRKPENFELSTLEDKATSFNSLTKEMTERLKIKLSDIMLATNNFDRRCCIGSGGYGMVYKAELEHLDIQNISSFDWKNNNELPKKRSIVAIKRIFNEEGEEGFVGEIETLTSCKHPNVVSLLGFSRENREMILVFEFALKGSLDNCLENNTFANVTWSQRIQICLDVARGLNYLHANLEGKRRIVHRDIKSANILLDDKWNAKVADFGLSKFHPENQQASTIHTVHVAGTNMYLDPEYSSTYKYKKESDIYSFGVVLFEILSGRLAYDSIYNVGNEKGLPTVARRRWNEGTIKELIDPDMMEEANDYIFTVNKGPNQKSLDVFIKIAHQCLAETQVLRPKIEDIIKELEDALYFQGKPLVLIKFQLSDIVYSTNNFASEYFIGVGAYGMMYNAFFDDFDSKSLSQIEENNGGELPKKHNNVALKRIFNREDRHGKQGFFAEIEMLAKFKHPSIVSLLGFSSEKRELILIYEDAFKGSLHDCLGNTQKMGTLTWESRIQISLDIAHGLNYLQTNRQDKQRIVRFDMNSANIFLDAKGRAKIACFWLSTLNPSNNKANVLNTPYIVVQKVQLDPEYLKIEKMKNESCIYSFGVILFEILCGKAHYDESYYDKKEKGLPAIARRCFEEGTILNEIIDPNLKEETDEKNYMLKIEVNQDSFDALSKVAYRCCAVTEADRPSIEAIIKELADALNIQDVYRRKRIKVENSKVKVKVKVKGTLVLIANHSIFEANDELFGQKVSLQLISAVRCESTAKGLRGMFGKETHLKNPVGTIFRSINSVSTFELEFDWEDEIGAFLIINCHHKEFYLKTLTLDNVPNVGRVHFICNSWVYPEIHYSNRHRVFFSNQTYLPGNTPEGLLHYRDEELEELRGNGTGMREEWDRVYDYDVYNDLSEPDKGSELVRPIFGGSVDHPYPRRCRTGRPLSNSDPSMESRIGILQSLKIYVPRDERFSMLKMTDVYAYGIKLVSQVLPPDLKSVIDKMSDDENILEHNFETVTSNEFIEFSSFDDVLKLYTGELTEPKLNFLESFTGEISFDVIRDLLRQHGQRLPKFPVPEVIKEDKSAWRTDEEFGRELLAGICPVVIRRLQEFPPTSKLDRMKFGNQNSSITEEHIKDHMDGLSVWEAMKNNRLFILDHHDPLMPYLRGINETPTKTYATRTILFLQNNGTLKPIAIELSLPHPAGDAAGTISTVHTPASHGAKGTIWLLAKAYANVNDSGYHQLVCHWLHTHATMEPFIIATNRQLSVLHPIHKLLHPHFRDTININALSRQFFISAGGLLEKTVFPDKYSMAMSSNMYKRWDFTKQALPADLIDRGMAVEDSTCPHGVRLVIEDYPFAVDGLEIWSAIRSWVKDYVFIYYKNDEEVQKDNELKKWWEEVRTEGHGDLKNEPWWPKMRTRAELIQSCTIIIWVASALHAAVNFGQYPYGGYLPNRPAVSRRLLPEPGTTDYDELEKNPEKAFLKTVTPQLQSILGISLIEIMSRHSADEVYLGKRDTPEWTADVQALEVFEKFRKNLMEIEWKIEVMNRDEKLINRTGPAQMPYTLLYPSSDIGLTGRGIPNSVSI